MRTELSSAIILTALVLSLSVHAQQSIKLRVDPAVKMQQIDGFGASDAWRTNFAGKYWPLGKREQMADWLFSSELDKKGNPKGIGLSMWRFNIGAGSKEQGEKSGIKNPLRRVECFLDKNGKYDFNKQAGGQWFLEAAKKRGVERFLAFTIAPPYFMARNGLTKSSDTVQMNIKFDCYDDYAEFLVKVMKGISKKHKINFDYISPVNEPQWDWNTPRQEGTFAKNNDCYKLIKELDKQITKHSLKTKIVFGEAAALKYLYANTKDAIHTDNQIYDFFNPKGQYYIMGMKNVMPCVSGHSYWSTYPILSMIKERKALHKAIVETSSTLKYWQTEYCVMEKNADMAGGWGRDLGIDVALYVARVIHYDMTVANAASWQWWTAISENDYKDALIYLDDGKSNGIRNDITAGEVIKYDGECRTAKTLWALGNYSRFVRPGMFRVDINRDGSADEGNILYSAYADKGKIVVVVTNYSHQPRTLAISGCGERVKMYCTSSQHDLVSMGEFDTNKITLPARSIITLTSTE